MDLITSLVNETTFVHMRRILVSLSVYLALMITLLWAPMLVLKALVSPFLRAGQLPEEVFALKVWYMVPEVQLPLELFIEHAVFLALLDTHKNAIGVMQHHWLSWASELLGAKEFLLPVVADADGSTQLLQRPPPGWDLRGPRHSVRASLAPLLILLLL